MKKKCGLLFGIGMVILISVMGCKMQRNYERNKMLLYMKYKYGREFRYVESYAGQLGKNYTTILVENKGNPKQRALVRMYKRQQRRIYEDNYLSYLLKEKLEKEIGTLAREQFGECKIYYQIPRFVFPEEFNKDMTFEQFLQNPCAMPQFYIYPANPEKEKEDWELLLKAFVQKNAQKGYQIRGTVSIAKNKENYEMITPENFAESDYNGYETSAELTFSMDNQGNIRYMRWISG